MLKKAASSYEVECCVMCQMTELRNVSQRRKMRPLIELNWAVVRPSAIQKTRKLRGQGNLKLQKAYITTS